MNHSRSALTSRLYTAWMHVGQRLAIINATVIFFLLFALVFAPFGLARRLLRKDPLMRTIDKNRESYFVKRDKQPESMRHQF